MKAKHFINFRLFLFKIGISSVSAGTILIITYNEKINTIEYNMYITLFPIFKYSGRNAGIKKYNVETTKQPKLVLACAPPTKTLYNRVIKKTIPTLLITPR